MVKKKQDEEEVASKKVALTHAIDLIKKQFGKGSIFLANEKPSYTGNVFSTGIPALDRAIGIGGIPRGKITEVYGEESCGKSTWSYYVAGQVQQKYNGTVAIVDVENSIDQEYLLVNGVDPSQLLVSQPDTGEEALEIVDGLARSNGVDLIIVDSVAALTPKAELEGEIGDSHVGLHARMMSQAMHKIVSALGNSNTTAIFINQMREKIGVSYGDPLITPGGRALKHAAHLRIKMTASKSDVPSDFKGKAALQTFKITKNKVAPPFKTGKALLVYGKGYDRFWSVTDEALDAGIIEKSGAWYSFGDQKFQRNICTDSMLDAIENAMVDMVVDNTDGDDD